MLPQVRDSRKYEPNSHDRENGPAEPLIHRFLVWPYSADEGRIKRVRSESKYEGNESHENLYDSLCQGHFLGNPFTRSYQWSSLAKKLAMSSFPDSWAWIIAVRPRLSMTSSFAPCWRKYFTTSRS